MLSSMSKTSQAILENQRTVLDLDYSAVRFSHEADLGIID